MSILQKFLGKKKPMTDVTFPVVVQPPSSPVQNAVIVKGEKHFDIFEDGNGYFRAQHKSGDWLYNEDNLFSYDNAKKFRTIEYCTEEAIRYVNAHLTTKVGTVEFIPNRK